MDANERPYIFIDTCSYLVSCWNGDDRKGVEYSSTKAQVFWDKEMPALAQLGQIILPTRNYEELVKHSGNTTKPMLASQAKEVLRRLKPMVDAGVIQIVGDSNDPFADAILLSVALKFRTQHNMLFVTQDRKLACDLEAIRYFRSVEPLDGYDIRIRRIGLSGALKSHRDLAKDVLCWIEESVSRGTESGELHETVVESPKKTTRQVLKSWWEGLS